MQEILPTEERGRNLSYVVQEIATLIEKTNVKEAKELLDWYRQWSRETRFFRAPEMQFRNWNDVANYLETFCEGKPYEEKAKCIFMGQLCSETSF